MAHFKLGEILLKQGLITEAQLKQAIEAQRQEKGRIGEVLVKLGFLREEDITSALGTQLGIPYSSANSDLLKPREEQDLDKLVPQDFAQKNCVLPLSRNMSVLTCAVADPLDLLMLDNLKMVTGHEITLLIGTRAELNALKSLQTENLQLRRQLDAARSTGFDHAQVTRRIEALGQQGR